MWILQSQKLPRRVQIQAYLLVVTTRWSMCSSTPMVYVMRKGQLLAAAVMYETVAWQILHVVSWIACNLSLVPDHTDTSRDGEICHLLRFVISYFSSFQIDHLIFLIFSDLLSHICHLIFLIFSNLSSHISYLLRFVISYFVSSQICHLICVIFSDLLSSHIQNQHFKHWNVKTGNIIWYKVN